jgi:NADH-quinone oxidoreductase E subunit
MKRETKNAIEALVDRYPVKRAALLPSLWAVQEEIGWIPPSEMEEIANLLEITAAEVNEVASFYTMFQSKPIGKYHIQVCTGVCCKLRGAGGILDHIRDKLGIDPGQTTSDERFHLSTVECLGSCGTAPMMQIGNDYYEDLTTEKVDRILETLSFRPKERSD